MSWRYCHFQFDVHDEESFVWVKIYNFSVYVILVHIVAEVPYQCIMLNVPIYITEDTLVILSEMF